jgi:hypothetical protein
MAEITSLSYRTFDELMDGVRIDLMAYQSHGDIDVASLIKVATRINYELGLRIHQPKETMLEIRNGRAALPADYHQMLIALSCYNYTHVQNAPWNGNVKLEEVYQTGAPQPSTCPCWTVVSTGCQTTYVDCVTGIVTPIYFPPGTQNLCAASIDSTGGHGGTISVSTSTFCYPGTNGVLSCSPPDTCNICDVTHAGPCPEVVINPYPLGQCRTICAGTGQQATIKILNYCSTQVFCYETFERLYIVPNVQADGFSGIRVRGNSYPENTGSINGRFLETHSANCSRVYIQYLGAMEDETGQLLVLDHPVINSYYSYALKERILENLYLNGGEDIIQRLKYTQEKKEFYRTQAMMIANTPDFRDVRNTNMVFKNNNDRQYWHTISRYFKTNFLPDGGWSSGADVYDIV